jgi:Raf kinase inhibitor-like YbhB/YbcL family protein
MILTSSAFNDGEMIPRKFTCEGDGINPELQIHNVPSNAKSLALVVHDPDAPIEGGFTHWVVWNINPATTMIKEESIPPRSVEGANSSGDVGWTAPCPPAGTGVHHYEFRLYALDVADVGLKPGVTMNELLDAAVTHIIEQAELIGLCEEG